MHHYNHINLTIIEVLNLIQLLASYIPRDLSFVSTQFLVLNLDGWFGVLPIKINVLIDIPLLHYCINLRSSIIFLIFSGYMYLSLGISLSRPIFSALFVTASELFSGEVLEPFRTFFDFISYFIDNHITSSFFYFLNCSF